ncbi:RNA polymerase subunit sigma-24, partial [Frankia sp. AiPs1]|nr:RNA polymerase subunit sigma-24 [Frankia sp. AiPs1]
MTDCTLADLAAGLAAVRRGPGAWARPPVPLLPTGAQVRATLSRFWPEIMAVTAPLPAAGPTIETPPLPGGAGGTGGTAPPAPAHPPAEADAVRVDPAARR